MMKIKIVNEDISEFELNDEENVLVSINTRVENPKNGQRKLLIYILM